VPFGDEVGEGVLHERWGVPFAEPLGRQKGAPRPRRGGDETHAKRRKEALGERADVEDALGAVERLKGVERPAGVAELAVVVVLDDARAVRLGEVETGAGRTASPRACR
jgi:hypothetical protein